MIGRYYAVMVCVYLATSTLAQQPLVDSIKSALNEKPKFFMGLNHRNTIIHVNSTKLYGLVAGADFNQKLKIYAGMFGFSGAHETLLRQSERFGADSVYKYVSTRNVSIGAEYTYYSYQRLSLSAPLQIGIGSVRHTYVAGDKRTMLVEEKSRMVPVEVGSNAYIELLPWVGVKGGFGYRLQVGKKQAFQYSSPYYSLGVSVLLGQIYKDLKENI
jgi:hypothetical protein